MPNAIYTFPKKDDKMSKDVCEVLRKKDKFTLCNSNYSRFIKLIWKIVKFNVIYQQNTYLQGI